MIDKDLTFIHGDEPEYSKGIGSNNTTDDNADMSFQDYSADDAYYYLYTRSTPLETYDDILENIDGIVEYSENEEIKDKTNNSNDISTPKLYSVKDSEIRLNALRTISNLKRDGKPVDAEAVIQTTMENMGIPIEIIRDVFKSYDLSRYIEDALLKEENSSLINKMAVVPVGILKSIRLAYDSDECKKGGDNLKGRLFAKNILSKPKLTYRNAKRKLGLLKKYKSKEHPEYDMNSISYDLYGGDKMCDFLENTLDMWRENIKSAKRGVSNSGGSNAFIKPHEKSGFGKTNESMDYIPDTQYGDFFSYSDTNPMEDVLKEYDDEELKNILIEKSIIPERLVREMSKNNNTFKTNMVNSGYTLYRPTNEKSKYKVFIPPRCCRDKIDENTYLINTRSCVIEYRDI